MIVTHLFITERTLQIELVDEAVASQFADYLLPMLTDCSASQQVYCGQMPKDTCKQVCRKIATICQHFSADACLFHLLAQMIFISNFPRRIRPWPCKTMVSGISGLQGNDQSLQEMLIVCLPFQELPYAMLLYSTICCHLHS